MGMTNGEIRRDETAVSALRKIALELERANKLKAIQLRREYADNAEEIEEIMKGER